MISQNSDDSAESDGLYWKRKVRRLEVANLAQLEKNVLRRAQVNELTQQLAAAQAGSYCVWDNGNTGGEHYYTQCGDGFGFAARDVEANRFAYCPFCGGKINDLANSATDAELRDAYRGDPHAIRLVPHRQKDEINDPTN